MELHWGKHHRAYVTNLNGQIKGTDLESKSLEEIVKATWGGGKPTPAFNNAAQVWNHTFYWESMSPKKTSPSAALAAAIDRDFGSLDTFAKEFSAAGATQFGSGWAWLVVDRSSGKLSIRKTANAETPLTDDSVTAILTMDGTEGRRERVLFVFFPLLPLPPPLTTRLSFFFLSSYLPFSSFPFLFPTPLPKKKTRKNSLGARLLPRLREQEARVHRRVRQRADQLGQGRGEVRGCWRKVTSFEALRVRRRRRMRRERRKVSRLRVGFLFFLFLYRSSIRWIENRLRRRSAIKKIRKTRCL